MKRDDLIAPLPACAADVFPALAQKIHGHRLVQREQLHAAAVDLDMKLIDRRVAAEDLLHQVDIAVDQRLAQIGIAVRLRLTDLMGS